MTDRLHRGLLLSLAGLGARDLGGYGNTWIETPGFDRLTAQSLMFEQVLSCGTAASSGLLAMLRGHGDWQSAPGNAPSIHSDLAAHGIPNVLFTDQPPGLIDAELAACFDDVIQASLQRSPSAAANLESTQAASFFAQLLQVRDSLPESHFLTADYRGLLEIWDAPTSLRQQLELDENVPLPTRIDPYHNRHETWDQDQILAAQWAWAAEVTVLDRCMEVLFDEIRTDPSCGLIMTSPHGYPLGEHGVVGMEPPQLYGEMTSVPCLVYDGSLAVGWRCQAPIQITEIGSIVRHWFANRERLDSFPCSDDEPRNDAAHFVMADNQILTRTRQWLMLQRSERQELYVKPDDRWEFNDVAQRCPEIIAQLQQLTRAAGLPCGS